jgi:hypothetical protein
MGRIWQRARDAGLKFAPSLSLNRHIPGFPVRTNGLNILFMS